MPYYAFIVGVNQDWPEQRCTHGDIGLARCLSRNCHLPKENLAEVYDERATRSNILRVLERLLDRRNETLATRRSNDGDTVDPTAGENNACEETDTLLFYYGGHGKRTAFCTQQQSITNGKIKREPWIKHSDIIDLLERKFKGGTAVCIIDCCHSGGFGEAVVQKHNDAKALNVKYGCIMSVAPADIAGLEWSMSECFIRAFKGELLCSRDERDHCYYLSTKKGIHPINESRLEPSDSIESRDTAAEKNCSTHPTWEQVIEYLADEMARIKGDRLTTLFWGEGMEDGKFLEKPCVFGDNIPDASSSISACIPRDETWMDPFRRKCHAVNDRVYAKCPKARHIGWFPGQIISIRSSTNANGNESNTPSNHPTACIELYDVISKAQWTTTLPLSPSPSSGRNAILGGLPFSFGFGFDPQPCINVITHMAKKIAYYDTTVPPNIHVKVLWEDGKYYKAKTLCRTSIPWEEVDLHSSPEMIGACAPLRWKDDDSISFVPTTACIVKDTKKSKGSNSKHKKNVLLAEKSSRDAAESIPTPMDAMLASLACEGKKLHGDPPILGGLVTEEDAYFWEAYDAEDSKWSHVQLMNKVDPSLLPLKVLAYHMCYRESESFSVVYWESESELSLVPNSYLRQRRTTENDSGEDSTDEESSVETAEDGDVRKYVDEACKDWDENLAENLVNPIQKQRIQLGSLAVICFGLGFILGSRSKR